MTPRLTAPATLTELLTALADVWQAMSVEHYRKHVKYMLRKVAAIIKDRGFSTLY